MLLNTPDCSEIEDGVAVGYARLVQLEPPLYSLSWTFYSADRQTRKICSHGILPFGPGHPIVRIKDTFEADLVRGWLGHCNSHHDCWTENLPLSGQFTLRVIDVEELCITEAPSPCHYAALSYVWGKIRQPVLDSKNSSFLSAKGSLSKLNLPQTVKDAIYICKSLQLRYFWVDSLCIEQDSIAQTDYLVSHMHDIYKQAYITLVVAAGTDCHSDIPSIRKRTNPQFCDTIQGIHVGSVLVNLEPLERIVHKSIWNSRAWTMQEYALSRRCLIFTDQGYFLSCARGAYVETVPGKLLQPRQAFAPILSEKRMFAQSGHDLILRTYAKAVYVYLKRELSYPSDVLRAFEGMTGAMAPFIGKSWWGLPHRAFRYTLCWNNEGLIAPRPGFPSWSWAGWRARDDLSRHREDYCTAFPSFGISNIWPYCTVYRWHSTRSLRPFQNRYKYAIGDWPKKPYVAVDGYVNTVLSSKGNARMHWMYEQPLTTDSVYQDSAYEIMFADRIPAFRHIPDIDFNLVLTFLSCTTVFPSDSFVVNQEGSMPSHTYNMASVERHNTSVTSTNHQRPLYSHSDPEPSASPITFVLIGHVQFQSKVVVLPVNITVVVQGEYDDADEVVARRKGNPRLMDEDLFFEQARKAIVHLW
jgi:hypothetical protein